MNPFSYSDEEQKCLLDHYIAFRIRLADLDRLIYLRNFLLTTSLPAPTGGPDPDWNNTATMIGDLNYGYLASLFDSRADSLDSRVLLPKLYPERRAEIEAFFSRHQQVIKSIARFRHKAVAHVDNTLSTLLEAHSRRYDNPVPDQLTFWIEFLTFTGELIEGEGDQLGRFTIDVKQHLTQAAKLSGMMPRRLMSLLKQFGFEAEGWE
jgi:hypothetical protein